MSRNRSRISSSQSTASTSTNSGSKRRNLTQPTLEQLLVKENSDPLTQASIKVEADKLVRYVIQNGGQHVMFRKAEIQKCGIAKGGRNFQQVLEQAQTILKEEYGCSLGTIDTTTGKTFILSNNLPYINYHLDPDKDDEQHAGKILLLLILSHLFMTNAPVSDSSLRSFLKSLKIDIDCKHPVFGKGKEHLTSFIGAKYLHGETDFITKKVSYSWGNRSEAEISKMKVLEFVCKMYGDRKPQSWKPHYDIAKAQVLELSSPEIVQL